MLYLLCCGNCACVSSFVFVLWELRFWFTFCAYVCVSSFVFVLWKLRFCFTFCVCVVGIVFVFCSYRPS